MALAINMLYFDRQTLTVFFCVTVSSQNNVYVHAHHLDCRIHLCDFHREKAWNEWLSKVDHGVASHKQEVLGYLRNIANSSSKHVLEKNILTLKNSGIWTQSPRLQEYYNEHW